MDTPSTNSAVLFVDLTDSTRLYERLGDTAARETSSTAMSRWEQIVSSAQGRVVKRIGDELMCVFPSAELAARAAMDIQVALDGGIPELELELHAKIGFHAGPLLEEDGDLFGDTVNTAARMVSMAKPGEILTTAQTAAVLPPFYAACARSRGSSAVKGKSGTLELIELVWKAEEQTRMAQGEETPGEESLLLWLEYEGREYRVDAAEPVLRMGRHAHNEMVVDGEFVSRSHASIQRRKGRFVLVDESTNGTWVHPEEGGIRCVLKDESTLPAAGHLGLGEQLGVDHPRAVRFEVRSTRGNVG